MTSTYNEPTFRIDERKDTGIWETITMTNSQGLRSYDLLRPNRLVDLMLYYLIPSTHPLVPQDSYLLEGRNVCIGQLAGKTLSNLPLPLEDS